MKRISFIISLFVMLVACSASLDNADYIPGPNGSGSDGTSETEPDVIADNQIKVISFNVRTSTGDKNTSNAWDLRKKAIPPMFAKENPTVFGVQEARENQMSFLRSQVAGYEGIGVGRDDGKTAGETMGIFYKTSDVELVKWGTFWLSQTPDTPSKGWDAKYYRTATWAVFKHKPSGVTFMYVNTHLDNAGQLARQNGLLLIRDKIIEYNTGNWPVILTADFNSTTDDPIFDSVKGLMTDARTACPVTDKYGSYNGWGQSNSVIDHIFYRGFKGISFHTVRDVYDGVQYMSDHYPVSAVLQVQN